jgi:hypothetical protein
MHFSLECDHKLTKQYNTQFTQSLLKILDVFRLCVVEEPVTCTNSSLVPPPQEPAVPCALPDMPTTPWWSSGQLSSVQYPWYIALSV